MIQLVIPMAGLGSRFKDAGYEIPKPLLPIHGEEMYKVVLENLMSPEVSKVVLITPKRFNFGPLADGLSKSLGVETVVIEVDSITEGAAISVSLSRNYLDENLPIVTANSDQYVDFEAREFYLELLTQEEIGLVLTMQDSDPKWSFAKVGNSGRIVEIQEKKPISSNATVGIYGFKRAGDLFEAIDKMVQADDRTNGEFYVAPAYGYLEGFSEFGAGIWDLGPVGEVMHGIGIPADYEAFLALPISQRASERARELFKSML